MASAKLSAGNKVNWKKTSRSEKEEGEIRFWRNLITGKICGAEKVHIS
jgi:hypothetical protein